MDDIETIFKNKHAVMDLETVWYEAFPYLCGSGGIVAILHDGSGLLKGSGVLLIIASLTILRLRWVYRRQWIARMPTAAEIAALPIHDD